MTITEAGAAAAVVDPLLPDLWPLQAKALLPITAMTATAETIIFNIFAPRAKNFRRIKDNTESEHAATSIDSVLAVHDMSGLGGTRPVR